MQKKSKKPHVFETVRPLKWYRQQESNLYLALRRRSFCPLNYGGVGRLDCRGRVCRGLRVAVSPCRRVADAQSYFTVKIRSTALSSPARARKVRRRERS